MAGLLARGLSEEGHAVDVARTGDDALRMARAVEYDAIVLDLMLPGLDGVRGLPAAPRGRRLDAGADADGPRRRRGSRRAGSTPARTTTCEAVLVRGAARTTAGARRGAGAAERPERPRGRRPAPRPGDAPGLARRHGDRALGQGVRPARDLHAPARPGALRATSCSSTRGTTPTRTARTSSTSTSATCATRSTGRSAATRSRRSAASATACARTVRPS